MSSKPWARLSSCRWWTYRERASHFWLSSRADSVYAAAGLIASLIVRVVVRLRVHGVEHIPAEEPALLVANHVSHFDPVVVSVIAHRHGRQVRLVAVQELFEKPLLGSLAKAVGWIPVTSGGKATAITEALAALARRDLVLIYPEGTIPAAGATVPARPGAAVIAIRARVPAIPVASDGLGRDAWTLTRPRRRVTVRIGCPINYTSLEATADNAGYAAAAELLLAAVRGLAATRSPPARQRAIPDSPQSLKQNAGGLADACRCAMKEDPDDQHPTPAHRYVHARYETQQEDSQGAT
jgi:1-acyl-sn-glycerol-3-phosphate acyltransferase